jgi:hypothetical protein
LAWREKPGLEKKTKKVRWLGWKTTMKWKELGWEMRELSTPRLSPSTSCFCFIESFLVEDENKRRMRRRGG